MANSSNAQIGSQTVLAAYDLTASPNHYSTVGYVRSISGVGAMKPEVDSTTLDSTAVERIGGLPDGKEVTVVLTTTSTIITTVEGWLAQTEEVQFRLTIPSPASVTRYFSLIVLDYEHSQITPSGLMELTFKGRITGSIATVEPSHS